MKVSEKTGRGEEEQRATERWETMLEREGVLGTTVE